MNKLFKNIALSLMLVFTLLSPTLLNAGVSCIPPLCVEKLISSGGVNIFARDWGAFNTSRPTILFAHGFPHSDIIWQNQINSLLRHKYRIITLDLRGFGASDKPITSDQYHPTLLAGDIKAVLDAFGVNKAVLVGHSYGGSIITYFSFYGNNDRIKGMVYVDAAPALNLQLGGVPQDTFDGVALTLPGKPPTFIGPEPTYANYESGNKLFLTKSYFPVTAPLGDYRDILGQNFLVLPEVRKALLFAEPPDLTPLIANYANGLVVTQKIPVAIFYGKQDAIANPSLFQDFGNSIVGSKVFAYENQGHVPQLTNSNQFNKDLDTFIRKYCH